MAKWIVGDGCDKYVAQLEKLNADTAEIIGEAIYPAAGIVTDQIKANIQNLKVSGRNSRRGTQADPIDTITSAQKQGLIDGLGISKMKDSDGFVNVKVGEDGYNSQVSDMNVKAGWTSTRQANAMIARAVESGTSFRKKTPFIEPAVRKTRKEAEQAMEEELDKQIAERMK